MIDTKLLRQKILDLAIRGKLVPQAPSDEPASELLKRINAEKSVLVKSGKIKKEKPLPPISESEIPFPIPDSWEWVRLGKLFSVVSARRVHKADWKSSGIPFYRAREIAKLAAFGFVDNELFISQDQYEEYKQSSGAPNPGDIMVTAVGTIGKAYVVKKNDVFYYKDASVICLENCHKMNSLFFKYCFSASFIVSQIFSKSTGTTVDTITIEKAEQYVFPLPPLAEQERIVAKVEALMNEVDTIERETENLNRTFALTREKALDLAIRGKFVPQDPNDEPASELLKRIQAEKAALVKSGKLKKEKTLPPISESEIPFDIPASWSWTRLGEFTHLIMGQSPDGNTVHQGEDGIEFHQGKIYFGERYLDRSPFVTTDPTRIAPENSVLICVRAPVGVVNITPRAVCVGRGLAAAIPMGAVSVQFLAYWISTQKDVLISNATGSTFLAVSAEQVRNLLLPLPPLAEQARIVTKIESFMNEIGKINHN